MGDELIAWLHDVEPQLGSTADYAQVDVDTIIPLKGARKRHLAQACADMFVAVARHGVLEERRLFWELTIPVEHGTFPVEPHSGVDASVLLTRISFEGRLRGRSLPGFYLSNQALSDRVGPKMQRRTRLTWSGMPECVVHYRTELWGDLHDPLDNAREDALEFRVYPASSRTEAVFPL